MSLSGAKSQNFFATAILVSARDVLLERGRGSQKFWKQTDSEKCEPRHYDANRKK